MQVTFVSRKPARGAPDKGGMNNLTAAGLRCLYRPLLVATPPRAVLPTHSEHVGYHVYWALDLTALGVSASDRLQGPMQDGSGNVLVWPIGVEFGNVPLGLPRSRFVLIAVDANGHELAHVAPIETIVDDAIETQAYVQVFRDGVRLVNERLAAEPELAAFMADARLDDERRPVFERAIALEMARFFAPGAHGTTAAPAHDERVREAADRAIEALRRARDQANAVDAPVRLDRVSIDTLLNSQARLTLERVRAAIRRADHADAAARALARLKLGFELPIETAASILPGLTRANVSLALIAHATGDPVDPLLSLLRDRRFPPDRNGADQSVLVLYALWRARPVEAVRKEMLTFLRRMIRTALSARGEGMALWLAHEMNDPHVNTLVAEWRSEFDASKRRGWGHSADATYAATIDDVIAGLPVRDEAPALAGVQIRSLRVGRNELCPCGSGKKFKRCHADRPEQISPPAPTRAEHLAELAPRLQHDQVPQMERADLAMLDLTRLRDLVVVAVARRWTYFRDWSRARTAVDELRRRGFANTDRVLDEVVLSAISCRRFDVAQELVPELSDPAVRADAEVAIALALEAPDAFAVLRQRADAAVADETGEGAIELAHALLRSTPSLGILIARGALQEERPVESQVLIDSIEQARDDLLLPPADPFAEEFAARFDVEEEAAPTQHSSTTPDALSKESKRLQEEVDAARSRLAMLQQQATERERELRRAEEAAAAAAQRTSAASDSERRVMRNKIDELKSLISAGNEERAELRQQLAKAAEAASRSEDGVPSRRHVDVDENEMIAIAEPEGGRRPVVPRFTERAAAALDEVDQKAAAMALRHIGALAAGDAAAWRGVKQAKDMPRQVLMVRIGIHHRLLFRGDAGELEVVDLVTRESLMTTLKHLRSR
jgi:hypothetical protein